VIEKTLNCRVIEKTLKCRVIDGWLATQGLCLLAVLQLHYMNDVGRQDQICVY
jgi:hypothetical protein